MIEEDDFFGLLGSNNAGKSFPLNRGWIMFEKKEARISKIERLFPHRFCYVADSDGKIVYDSDDFVKYEFYTMKRRDEI